MFSDHSSVIEWLRELFHIVFNQTVNYETCVRKYDAYYLAFKRHIKPQSFFLLCRRRLKFF